MKVFVPFSESLLEETGLDLGVLVPFKLEYECLRVNQTPVPEPAAGDPELDEAELQAS